jgi:hypothetical protein
MLTSEQILVGQSGGELVANPRVKQVVEVCSLAERRAKCVSLSLSLYLSPSLGCEVVTGWLMAHRLLEVLSQQTAKDKVLIFVETKRGAEILVRPHFAVTSPLPLTGCDP